MEIKATNVNKTKESANQCGKQKGGEEMNNATEMQVFDDQKGSVCQTMSYLGTSDCSARGEREVKIEKEKRQQSERARMRIWGMLSPEEEDDGFGVFLDADSYVLMLYYNDTLMALFDPYDYTLPELNDMLQSVIQTIRSNPLIVCSGRVFWSHN